ncbi:MAG: hypothetical protein H0V77_05130 [Actinobacteria bacterium]|nr:hypothetical protein [Actinomycetota bacterium]
MTDIDAGLQDFKHRCATCWQQPPDYLVVWPDGEEWRCDSCFHIQDDLLYIARHAEAIYYLQTCAQVKLTIKSMAEILEENGS